MYRCPKCHVELPADARFCNNCGFNQTNARIASMAPPVQGAQRQIPPKTQQGAQQSPARTIQLQNRYIPQQPVTHRQGPPPQPNTNIQVPQQNFPGTPPFTPQQAPGRTSTPQNAPWSMSPVTPRPQQGEALQRNNGSRQPMQQHVPVTPPLATPQQGNAASTGFQQHSPISRPAGPSSTQGPSAWVQQSPVTPQGQSWGRPNQGYMTEQVMRSSTPPLPTQQRTASNTAFEPLQWGLGALPDTPVSIESIETTSKAAQHWRQSWLERQRAEAGPAVDVSRGQASVQEPLLAMHHSFARMRAIILPKNAANGKSSSLRFWLPVILLVCLIGGLSTYVLSTYSGGPLGANLASSSTNAEPTLTMKTAKTTTTVAAGQAVHVHGEHFGPNDPIVFFLGGTQLRTAGATQSNDKGVFDASLPIPATQLAGEYAIQAQDNHTGQHAFLNIQTTASTTTDVLKLSVPALSFASIIGHDNPQGQSVSITNTSNAVIQWSATAITDNQTGWLLLDNGKTSGQLDAGQTDKIRVSVLTQVLTSSPAGHPYKGEIVFTLTDQGQVTLPVQLTLSQTGVELMINPNPLFALQSPTIPGGCQDITLTLINLSDVAVSWDVQTDGFSQQHITLDGKPDEKGQLLPSGSPNDTQVIKIGCNGVQLDKTYAVNVFYNGSQQLVPISVTKG